MLLWKQIHKKKKRYVDIIIQKLAFNVFKIFQCINISECLQLHQLVLMLSSILELAQLSMQVLPCG